MVPPVARHRSRATFYHEACDLAVPLLRCQHLRALPSRVLRRHLFTFAAIGSAAIALLAAGLWVRSFFASDVWSGFVYAPASASGAGTLDARAVQAMGGWVLVVRSRMLLPPGAAPPQSPRPM